jgi:hypothetical protein
MRMAGFTDAALTCGACAEAFVFSAGEQELQALRGLVRRPDTCPICRRTWPGVGPRLMRVRAELTRRRG